MYKTTALSIIIIILALFSWCKNCIAVLKRNPRMRLIFSFIMKSTIWAVFLLDRLLILKAASFCVDPS